MEAPRWRYRGKTYRYHKSFVAVVVAVVDDAVVDGYVTGVTVPEEVEKTEEGGG